jgi:hypothetical protein
MSSFRHIAMLGVALGALVMTTDTTDAQCTGEAAAVSPCGPRVVSGAPGTRSVVVDASNTLGGYEMNCGFNVGHVAWYEVTPEIDGQLTFNSCHPATSFDTVVQAWRSSGDCEFPVRMDDLCADDTESAACTNGCSFFGGNVTLQVLAGETYLFEVGAYNDNNSGCDLCLGVNVTLCGADTTAPIAKVDSPTSFSCGCDTVQIVGTAADDDDGFGRYALEYRPVAGGAWTTIDDSTTPVTNGVLGNWNTAALTQGYYFLRLTAENACGKVTTDMQVVWVDGAFDSLVMGSPAQNGVYGGNVCLDGTAWDNLCFDHYTLNYRPVGGGGWSPIGAGVFNGSVINNPLSTWDTTSVPDGAYEIRIVGETTCGNTGELIRTIVVDNTPPTVNIADPLHCEYVDGVVQIYGTAIDANINAWTLQVAGGDIDGWQTLNSGVSNVMDVALADWDTSSLPSCAYVLRLIASDEAVVNCDDPHQTAHYVTLNVGYCGDFDTDDDGDVDLIDFRSFQDEFTGPLP